jgi:hypothetical protein
MGYREELANRNKCEDCTHYEVPKHSMPTKCWHPDNMYKNWLGWINKESPETKNHNGGCKDYEEIDRADSSGSAKS